MVSNKMVNSSNGPAAKLLILSAVKIPQPSIEIRHCIIAWGFFILDKGHHLLLNTISRSIKLERWLI